MTTYTITIGYQSGYSGEIEFDELCQIVDEAIYVNTRSCSPEMIAYANQLMSHEKPAINIDKGDEAIRFTTSGGGAFRTAKEWMVRAILRGVLERVHKRGGEININVF